MPARLDARLAPAALTSWAVTAAGIIWPIGSVVGSVCAVVSMLGLLLWRAGHEGQRMRAIGVSVLAVGVVGAGFGFGIALRANAVARHPVSAVFGTAAQVVVTPSESAVSVGRGRLMFRATLRQLGPNRMSGRVVVFAPARDFNAVMVGQPVRFRARITRPTRHDLTVAAVNAIGQPTMGRAGPIHRAAHAVRTAFAATARQVLPADQAAMLPALVLGDTSTVSTITTREFRAAGLTHLTGRFRIGEVLI
jgi:competence protein ComEC